MVDDDLRRAKQQWWAFHWGRPPKRTLRVAAPPGAPGVLVQLGTLVALELARGLWVWPSEGTVQVATDVHGRDLYLVAAGGIAPDGEHPGGTVAAIRYRTNKGDGDQVWRHAFEGERRPRLRWRDGWPILERHGSRYRVTWRGIEG